MHFHEQINIVLQKSSINKYNFKDPPQHKGAIMESFGWSMNFLHQALEQCLSILCLKFICIKLLHRFNNYFSE